MRRYAESDVHEDAFREPDFSPATERRLYNGDCDEEAVYDEHLEDRDLRCATRRCTCLERTIMLPSMQQVVVYK